MMCIPQVFSCIGSSRSRHRPKAGGRSVHGASSDEQKGERTDPPADVRPAGDGVRRRLDRQSRDRHPDPVLEFRLRRQADHFSFGERGNRLWTARGLGRGRSSPRQCRWLARHAATGRGDRAPRGLVCADPQRADRRDRARRLRGRRKRRFRELEDGGPAGRRHRWRNGFGGLRQARLCRDGTSDARRQAAPRRALRDPGHRSRRRQSRRHQFRAVRDHKRRHLTARDRPRRYGRGSDGYDRVQSDRLARRPARPREAPSMIIDCHGHYTTSPRPHEGWRGEQIEAHKAGKPPPPRPKITDDEIRESIEGGQLKVQRERGTDLTIFSPRAAGMGHHLGDATTSEAWASACNELIHRVCSLFPKNFIGVAMLPQSARVSPKNCIPEIDRCVTEYGFVGVNLNPDPSGGHWQDPPLGDRYWYPVYEKMVEHDIPAMIHVSASCNPTHHTTGAHYLNGDTAGFNQLMTSSVFKDFPAIKFIIPHGGGAVPYHWGRYRGLAQDAKLGLLSDVVLKNIYFDTCVYHLPGQELLAKVIPVDNILFASEMIGAVRGIDPQTGYHYDDTKRYVDRLPLSAADKAKIFEGNARRVYGRLSATIEKQSAR